jgi:hypothetical protein
MKGMRIVLAAIVLASLVSGIAQAGGRATVSILSAPKNVVSGQTFKITFAVQPEWPMARNRTVEPTVRATCGDRVLTLAASPLTTAGQYQAVFALPSGGDWVITVDSRYCETKMKALTLKAEPAKDSQG